MGLGDRSAREGGVAASCSARVAPDGNVPCNVRLRVAAHVWRRMTSGGHRVRGRVEVQGTVHRALRCKARNFLDLVRNFVCVGVRVGTRDGVCIKVFSFRNLSD